MAGPGGRPVGRVSIRVVPDTSTFAAALEAYLQRVESRAEVNIPVSLNAASVAATEAKLAALTRNRSVKIDVDSRGLAGLTGGRAGGGRGGGFFNLLTNPAVIVGAIAAIGGAMAALPGIIASIAGPLAAVAVGFEGIKRAAAGLALPFQVMQTTVSNVFEKAFLPGFQQLEKIMPTLTVGFNQMGEALGKIFTEVVGALTSPQGLQMLGQIFTNISKAMTTLAPSMGTFVDTFLRLAVAGTEAFARFAPLIAQIIVHFNEFVKFADKIGLLKLAMDGFGIAIVAVLTLIFGLVAAGTLLVAAVGAIAAAFRIAGTAVVTAVTSIVGLVTALPGRISGALSGLASAIGGAFTRAWAAARAAVTAGANAVISFVRGLPAKIKAGLNSLPGLLSAAGKAAMQGLWNGLKSVASSILSWAKSFASSVASTIASALRIRSPSRVMEKIGRHTMEGFRLGLLHDEAGVIGALLGLADSVAGIRPTVSAAVESAPQGSSVMDMKMQARFFAEALTGATFRMDSRGDLQLIAAGG